MGKNSVFATHIQHIENIKKITEVLPRPSPWSNYSFCLHLYFNISHIIEIYVKMCHFADFFEFENGCCYLNTIARKRRKKTWVSCIFV